MPTNVDYDFIGFTYNGEHSINNYNIYRTSDGNRYNDSLVPSMNDKTADIPGGDGQYYFYTKHKTKQFSISIAFDKLDQQKYDKMRTWLDGRGIHNLIFDEYPDKVYSAKVTGTPQLKTVCFNEDGERIYKGEGSIQFTCYYPYAHSVNKYTGGVIMGDLPTYFTVKHQGTLAKDTRLTVGNYSIVLVEATEKLEWDSKTGLVTGLKNGVRTPVPYTGHSYGSVAVGQTINAPTNCTIEYYHWYY